MNGAKPNCFDQGFTSVCGWWVSTLLLKTIKSVDGTGNGLPKIFTEKKLLYLTKKLAKLDARREIDLIAEMENAWFLLRFVRDLSVL